MFVMKQNLTATVKASSALVPEFVDLDGLRQIFGIKPSASNARWLTSLSALAFSIHFTAPQRQVARKTTHQL
jgi:hypothetical protein